VQLLGAAPRPPARLAHRRHGIERLVQHGAVVDVGSGEQDRERDTLPVDYEVPLAARLAAVGWVRPGCSAAGLGGQARRIQRAPAPVDQAGSPEAVEQRVVERLPDARLLPVAQPPPAGHAGAAAHLLRQHLPRDAALEHEEDAGQRGPGVDRRTTALRAWRMGRKQGAE